MGKDAVQEYLEVARKRYIQSTRSQKSVILTEFCANTGYERKYAIKLLSGAVPGRTQRSGPKPTYDASFKVHLVALWKVMRKMCGKRMKAALSLWLNYYSADGFTEEIKAKLLAISASSIDRILRPYKLEFRKGLSATKPGAFLKSQIPIELIDKNVNRPGFVESDTVAHCGSSLYGKFANSLTITDLLSGWTGNRAALGKEALVILELIKEIRRDLPFPMLGFAADNGSEFINQSLVSYLDKSPDGHVKFVRRRPYKKNDAAHVEQKNDATVRQLVGYSRIEDQRIVTLLNEIYRDFWNPFLNFFCPVMKLKKKIRIGGKIRKIYDEPKSPYERLMEHPAMTDLQKESLKARFELLDPFKLAQGLEKKLQTLFKLIRESTITNLKEEDVKASA
jgi:hypothetical protein